MLGCAAWARTGLPLYGVYIKRTGTCHCACAMRRTSPFSFGLPEFGVPAQTLPPVLQQFRKFLAPGVIALFPNRSSYNGQHFLPVFGPPPRLGPFMIGKHKRQPATRSLAHRMQDIACVCPQHPHVRTCYA